MKTDFSARFIPSSVVAFLDAPVLEARRNQDNGANSVAVITCHSAHKFPRPKNVLCDLQLHWLCMEKLAGN